MHEIPLSELKERLANIDEVTLLELLNLNSGELIELLSDYIEENYDDLLSKLQDEDDE